MRILKRIQVLVLVFVLVVTCALTPVKKTYAIALVDDMALVLGICAIFGISAYSLSQSAAENIDWSALSSDIENSYNSARDRFTVINGGGGNWDDEDGDGDEDADDLPTFESIKQQISTTGKIALTTNSLLCLYDVGTGLYRSLGIGDKLKFASDKINGFIDKLFPDQENEEYIRPVNGVTGSLGEDQGVTVYDSINMPVGLRSSHEELTAQGYKLIYVTVFEVNKSSTNQRRYYNSYYISQDIPNIDFTYTKGLGGTYFYKNSDLSSTTANSISYGYYDDLVKGTSTEASKMGSQIFIYNNQYTQYAFGVLPEYIDLYLNSNDYGFSFSDTDLKYSGNKITQYPVSPQELPDPTTKPIEIPTQERVEQLEQILNDPTTSTEEKEQAINDLTVETNPNLDQNSDPGTNPDPDPGTGTDPVPDPDPNPDPEIGSDASSGHGSAFLLPDYIKNKFPFSIPFDLVDAFTVLESADRRAPRVTWDLVSEKYNVNYTFDIDMSEYDSVASIFRNMELLLFSVGLILLTRSIIRG